MRKGLIFRCSANNHLNSIPLSLTQHCVDSTDALLLFPLHFLNAEMRLQIELCIFHETVNARALAAPPQCHPSRRQYLYFFLTWLLIFGAANKLGG